jgi:histidinol phosphatase-like enzyme
MAATVPFAASFAPAHIVHTTTVSSIKSLPAAALGMINNDAAATTTLTETMRKQSVQQYSDVMDHFMFELGNDMVFLQNQNDVSKYIDERFDAILFDCDGVLYRGTDAIPDAGSSLKSLLKQGKKVLFVTNNAGSNRMELRDKLSTILDCPELREDQMVLASSGYSKELAEVLSQEYDLNLSRTLLVGDRLDTNIKFGKDNGIKTALVFTGYTTADILVDLDVGRSNDPFPQIIFPHVGMMGVL